MKPVSRRPLGSLLIISICLLFLGVNGIWGGYLMLSNPDGDVLGMPISFLDRTPFQNWFIPGLFLTLLWGCGSLIILLSLWLRPNPNFLKILSRATHKHWVWVSLILLGCALLVWLSVQVFTLPAIAPIQYILAGLALVLIVVPFVPGMRHYYEQRES